MSTLCWAACKALIEQQPPKQRKKLLELLPASKQAELLKAPSQKPLFSTLSPDEILDVIHPSWLIHILQPCTESERCFFISTLTPSLASQLKKLLDLQKPLPTVTPLGKAYLRGEMLALIKKERGEAIPKAALPESKLNILLDLDANRFSILAFQLGLYDLAEELRFAIDKQTWLQVESTLSPNEWQTLKTFQMKKERLTFGRMPLKDFAEPRKLRLLIEQYGMNRLAKAFHGENSSLLWHLSLHLDRKRAEFLSRLCGPLQGPLEKPELKEVLQQQILALIPLLPTEQPKRAP